MTAPRPARECVPVAAAVTRTVTRTPTWVGGAVREPVERGAVPGASAGGPIPATTPAVGGAAGRPAASPATGAVPDAVPVAAVRTAARLLRGTGVAAWAEPDGTVVARDGGREARCSLTWHGLLDLPGVSDESGVEYACGLAHVHGRRYGRPAPIGVDYASAAAAVLAGLGTLSALLAGRPRLSTSVAQAALVCVSQYLAAETAEGDAPNELTERGSSPESGQLDAGSRSFAPEHAPSGGGCPARDGREPITETVCAPPLTSGDGCRFELEALAAEAWRDFWTGLGAARADIARGWPSFQQRYSTAVCELPAALVRLAAARPYRELAAAAERCGADLTPLRDLPDPSASTALPWSFTVLPVPPDPDRPAAPTTAFRTAVRPGAGPLDGLVVVEVTRRVQGPLATHLLALLGARVIRVEPPGGDPQRGVPPMAGAVSARYHALNHGKQPVEADLGTPAGRAAVRELAAEADVFVHSLAPGKDAALGLDAATLAAARPGLVYARASGWGGERGPLPPVGTDFPVQAYSGLSRLVTPPGRPPAPSLMTLTDVLGGMICAQGAVAALLRARRDGAAHRVDTSLLSAARLLCDRELRSAGGTFASGPLHAPAGHRSPRDPAPYDDPAPYREPHAHPYREPFSVLARDPAYAPALYRDGCVLVRPPWDFT